MTTNAAVVGRAERLREHIGLAGLVHADRASDVDLDAASRAFADSLYPPRLAGPVVLERGAAPEACDRAVRAGRCYGWIEAIDAASAPFHWWYGSHGPPRQDRFRAPFPGEPLLVGKPTTSCVFTAGGTATWRGMWSSIAQVEAASAEPIHAWRLDPEPGVRGIVVDSAVGWCELVSTYGRRTVHGLVVDWAALAAQCGAVTVTAAAVAATDCIELAHHGRRIAPTFWATRTTVWLDWLFVDRPPADAEVPSQ